MNPIPCWPIDDTHRVTHFHGVARYLGGRELVLWFSEWALPEHDDVPRPAGCLCQWEQGDSPCPVHGEEEP